MGAQFRGIVVALAAAALAAATLASGAELETAELDMTPPANDVSLLQGATATDVRITVKATGPISCEITQASPATVRVMREYTIDSAGNVNLTLLGGPRSIYAGAPLPEGDCAVAWDAPPYPEPFRIFTSVTAAADAPPGDYVVPIAAQISSPPVSGPGLVDEVPSSFVVHVIQVNRPPAVGLAAANVVSSEGSALHVTGSFTDPDGDALTLTSTAATGLFTDNGDGTWSWSLATNDETGPAEVTVTATDPDGLSAIDTFSYAALNVAPTGVFPASATVAEGDGLTLAFAGQADLSTADVEAGLRYAYSCGAPLPGPDYATSLLDPSVVCRYPDGPAGHTAGARIIDVDGGFSEYATAVSVVNVAPQLVFSPTNTTTIDEGTSTTAQYRFAYTVRDPGDDTVAAVPGISCGAHGTLVSGSATPPGAEGSFACTFKSAEGPLRSEVTAAARDSDGDTGAPGVQVVTVRNLPAAVTITMPLNGMIYARGMLVSAAASFTDKGKTDTHTCSVSWGDGQTTRGTLAESGGIGRCVGSKAYTTAGSYRIVVTVVDDDGDAGSSAPRSISVR